MELTNMTARRSNIERVLEKVLTCRNAQVVVIGHSFSDLDGFGKELREEMTSRLLNVVERDYKSESAAPPRASGGAAEEVRPEVELVSFIHRAPTRKNSRLPSLRIADDDTNQHDGKSDVGMHSVLRAQVLIVNTDLLVDTSTSILLQRLSLCVRNGVAGGEQITLISLHDCRTMSTGHEDNMGAAASLLSTEPVAGKWPRVVSSLTVPWLVPREQLSFENMRRFLACRSITFPNSQPWHHYRPLCITRRDLSPQAAEAWVCTYTMNRFVGHMDYAWILNSTYQVLKAHFGHNFTFFPVGTPLSTPGQMLPQSILRFHRPQWHLSQSQHTREALREALHARGWSVHFAEDSKEWLPLVPPITPSTTLRLGNRVWNCKNAQLGTVVGFQGVGSHAMKGLEATTWPMISYDAKPQDSDIELPCDTETSSRISWTEETSLSLPIVFSGALTPRQLVASDVQCPATAGASLPPVAVRMGQFQSAPQLLMWALRYAKRPLMFHEVSSTEHMRRSLAHIHSRWFHNAVSFLKP